MNTKSLLKKTAKLAGATCVAAGAIAILTSGAALTAIVEGGKYLGNTFRKIVNEQEQPREFPEDAPAASEEDFAGAEEPETTV